MISNHISDTLSHNINECIKKSLCPVVLKIAEVIPIYKSGNKQQVSNYRPFSSVTKTFF